MTDPPPFDDWQDPLDEVALVMRAQQGDQWAFNELYAKYNNQMNIYLTRMVGNDNVGNDLTQETFLKAWESLSTLRDATCFKSWLYRIATNIALNHRQRVGQISFSSLEIYQEKDNSTIIGNFEDRISETEILRQALARVNPTYRPCLILYVVEELSQREIAELLKINVNNVSKYVSRGKEDLRQVYYRLLNGQNTARRRPGR